MINRNKKMFLLGLASVLLSACSGNILLQVSSQGGVVNVHGSYLVDVQTYTPSPTLISSPFPTPTQDFAPTLSPIPTLTQEASNTPTFTTNTPMPTATIAPTATPTAEQPVFATVTCDSGVNVRMLPFVSSTKLDAIPLHKRVRVVGRIPNWLQIEYGDVLGQIVVGWSADFCFN